MSATIVLTQNNVVKDGQNNSLVYTFPNSVSFPHHQIAVQAVSMFYCWNNISSALGNNTFTFTWTVGSTPSNVVITLPDGMYNISDIQAYIENYCISQANYYITNTTTGRNIFYLQLLINPTAYAVQLNTFPVPTSLPVNCVLPTNWSGYPTISACPQVTFPSNFCNIVGFTANYQSPSSLTQFSINSNNGAPQVQPNPSLFLAMSNIDNKYAIPSSIIYSITPTNVEFGGQIIDRPPQFAWNRLLPGTYNSLRLSILGTNLSSLPLLDPNMTILLTIRDTKDLGIADLVNVISGGK